MALPNLRAAFGPPWVLALPPGTSPAPRPKRGGFSAPFPRPEGGPRLVGTERPSWGIVPPGPPRRGPFLAPPRPPAIIMVDGGAAGRRRGGFGNEGATSLDSDHPISLSPGGPPSHSSGSPGNLQPCTPGARASGRIRHGGNPTPWPPEPDRSARGEEAIAIPTPGPPTEARPGVKSGARLREVEPASAVPLLEGGICGSKTPGGRKPPNRGGNPSTGKNHRKKMGDPMNIAIRWPMHHRWGEKNRETRTEHP